MNTIHTGAGKPLARLLMLLTLTLPMSAFAVQEIVVTDQDAELRQELPASNFGTGLVLDVRVQKAADNLKNQRAVVGFDFTGGDFLGCTVDSAAFEMFNQTNHTDRTLDVHPLTGAWAENTVSWTIAGGLTAGALQDSTAVTAVGTASWDVSPALVQTAIDNSARLTLRVKDNAEAYSSDGNINVFNQFTSREGAAAITAPVGSFAPRLVLEMTCDECETWEGETAWADGDPYVNPGNWATYTAYAADNTVTLYAGQTFEAGTVNFSGEDSGFIVITITLNAGYRFVDAANNVKVENYDVAPSGNPAPGQFSDKDYADPDSNTFEIVVPVNDFYGVHVDVERCADAE